MSTVVMLSSSDGKHARSSGYDILSKYVSDSVVIERPRRDPTRIGERLIARGSRMLSVSKWYRWSSIQLEIEGYRAIRRHRPEILHLLWGDRDLGFLDLVGGDQACSLCVTFHACRDELPNIIRFPHRLRRLDAIILMAEDQREYFQQHGVDDTRVFVVHHGIDTNYFSPGGDGTATPFVVLSVGSYRRDFQRLRQLCESMLDSPVQFRLVLPLQFHRLFQDLPNVKLLSGITDEELREEYRMASCFLFTTEAATANNALLEALSCGAPIVAEAVGGVPEYLSADCGVLVQQGDHLGLRQAILGLVGSPLRRKVMSIASRNRAMELDWSNVARQTEAVYARSREMRRAGYHGDE